MVAAVKALIVAAAMAHAVSAPLMLAVADCESHTNPFAVSADGANLGLYQLNRAGKLPVFYRRGYDDPFDPAQQSNFAAEQFAVGEQWAWSCARIVGWRFGASARWCGNKRQSSPFSKSALSVERSAPR